MEETTGVPTPLDAEARAELEEKCVDMELQLDGKIYLVQKDEKGNEILRDELDSETVLQALASVVSEAITNLTEEETT